MAIAERKLTKNQTKILKALKRKPRTSRETAEYLNNQASRGTGYAFGSHEHTYDSVHSSLRGLEDREYVRRVWPNVQGPAEWQLTDKARDLLG